MIDWKREKENIEKLINDGFSYEEIGRQYGCCGANVKKAAIKLGIKLFPRRNVNEKETFNKGVRKKKCLNCGRVLVGSQKEYCSIACQTEYAYKKHIKEWLDGKRNGSDKYGNVSDYVKKYVAEKCGEKCQICGFSGKSKYTGKSILQIHHIDGDCMNNKEENLQLLCPNCHAMTENFGRLNKKGKRKNK